MRSSRILLALLAPAIAAAEDPLSDEQLEKILKHLEGVQEELDGKRVSTRTSAVSAFTTAAASDKAAYEFYLDCHKALKFDAVGAKFTEFRDWRDRNEGKVKTKENLAAMRIQLQYLVLTIRAAEGVDRELIVPEVEQFVTNVVANVEELGSGGMRTLRGSVKGTIFAEAYDLDRSLEVDNWSFAPGDYAGAFEQTIFPFVREEIPTELGATWDRRIALERRHTQITQEDNDIALEKFETERLPRLHWQKAQDLYKSVSQTQGAAGMLKLVQTYPEHPDIADWVKSFRELLTAPPIPEGAEVAEPVDVPRGAETGT